MNARERDALDRYITGNYGEDQFREPSVSDESVIENIHEARDNGYDFACVECGVGITDSSDIHDLYCSKYVRAP
jgi:hypothetical protein